MCKALNITRIMDEGLFPDHAGVCEKERGGTSFLYLAGYRFWAQNKSNITLGHFVSVNQKATKNRKCHPTVQHGMNDAS